MNILVLSPFVPYPLDQGGKIRTFNIIRNLARSHAITLATLADDGLTVNAGPLEEYCEELVVVDRPARLWPDRIAFFSGSDPYNVIRYHSAELRRKLAELRERKRFDLVLVEFSMMWQYADLFPGVPVVLDAHNIEADIITQIGQGQSSRFWKFFYGLEERRLRRCEQQAWQECALCCTVSDRERTMISVFVGNDAKVLMIPNGVDLERFAFRPKRATGKDILFLCGMDYLPNLDSASYFLEEIFPLVRKIVLGVRLNIVGRELWKIGDSAGEGAVLHENVPDVLPWLAGADLLVVPLRHGAGTRIKIMEAMAAGVPVVTTSKGCEGIAVANGEHLLIADTPEEFAAAVGMLLGDRTLADRLRGNARRLVEMRYSWEKIVLEMQKHAVKFL